jgi:hypothetical protein
VHYIFFKEAIYSEKTAICRLVPTSAEVDRNMFLGNNDFLPNLGIDKVRLLDKTMQFLQRADENVEWRL